MKYAKILLALVIGIGLLVMSLHSENQEMLVEDSTMTTSLYIVTDNHEDEYVEAVSLDRALEFYPVYLKDGEYETNETLRISTDHNGEPVKIERVTRPNNF